MAEELAITSLNENNKSGPTLFFYNFKKQIFKLNPPKRKKITTLAHPAIIDDTKITDENYILNHNIENYIKLNNLFDDLHFFSQTTGQAISNYISKGKVVTGQHIHLLSKTVTSYHLLGEQVFNYISIYGPESLDQNDFIDLSNIELTKKNLFWLIVKIDFFEKLLTGYNIYYRDNPSLRRMLKHIYKINRDNEIMGDRIKMMFKTTLKRKPQKKLKKLIKIFQKRKSELIEQSHHDLQLIKILNLLDQSMFIKELSSSKLFKVKFYQDVDDAIQLGKDIINSFSRFFGNVAGSIRWRKGYLNRNYQVAQELRAKLWPLDIILEKTPFALTDTFIPGFFGHAAIWLGTEEQIKELGMWDHPLIIPLREKIKAGYSIVESLRPGVSLNTIEGFLNVDHLSILRIKSAHDNRPGKIYDKYTVALSQFNKEYDFNFDVTTLDKIVCSELIYHTFGEIKWPTKPRLGRPTIEPDHLAELNFYDNSPIEFVHYIESYSKTNIKNKNEIELGKKLNFVVNEERSTPNNHSYDKKIKRCRNVKKKTRYAHGSRRINKRYVKTYNVCNIKLKQLIYRKPELF